MASEKVTYNVPGIGNLTANIFAYTQHISSFLDHYGHLNRLKKINQLGCLREVFQGAHHNRYEYVFLQLTLISELCLNKQNELGLSGERKFAGKINALPKYPTTGELLQCLVLLTNMGYLEGTFSTSRAWLTYLKENREAYTFFIKGLDGKDRRLCKDAIEKYDYYKFHVFIALFQLQRYKRRGGDIVEFASNLLGTYLSDDNSNIQILQLRRLYDSIRQIAFVTLDSLYAPVPFNLDLASILLNFESLVESLFIRNTTYRMAFRNLEEVLQNSVYLASDSCLNTARASERKLTELRNINPPLSGISALSLMLTPNSNRNENIFEIKELDWHKERKLVQEYRLGFWDRNNLPAPLLNEVKWEIETKTRLGMSLVSVGLLANSRKRVVRLTFGLKTKDNLKSLKSVLKICSEVINFEKLIPERPYNKINSNNEFLLSFICKSILGWNNRFLQRNGHQKLSAILISVGRVDMLRQVDEYLKEANQYLNSDEVFEVEMVRELINTIHYSGLTIAFIGGLKVFNEGQNQEVAEFDGLIVRPRLNLDDDFAHIVEAKNFVNGVTQARSQLDDRLRANLIDELSMTINDLGNRAAYAAIRIQQNP